ncbi:hypothetical protein F4861DRAFT_551301 [Xylaria intraflava]|nr:hypothetical protein F4861DRAFT_551301 [Xylaria intraflava]
MAAMDQIQMLNWTTIWSSANMQPAVAPDVEADRAKHGNTQKIDLAVWIVAGLASGLVAVRICYHVFRGRRHLWSDDYFLLAALACLIANGIAVHEWIPYKYEPNVTTPASPHLVLAGSLMGLFNSLALALSKTSLAITFMRLVTGWWKSSLGISLFVINILYAIQGWTFWVQDCYGPVEPYRIQSSSGGCLTFESISAFRLSFTVLPWKIVRSLELKRFEKIGLGIAMSFGCASLASGLVRLTVLLRLVNQSEDHQPFYAVGGYLFNYFEPGYSIVAACMPVLRKVFIDIIKWKKKNSIIPWTLSRRKRGSESPTLPVVETPVNSTPEIKFLSEATDTTLATLTTITVPAAPSPTKCSTCNREIKAQE